MRTAPFVPYITSKMTQVQMFEGSHSFVEAGSLRETPSLSLGLENDDYTMKRELKIHKRSGVEFGISLCRLNGELFITDVLDFSPAWRCGLRTGDRIERIDNLLLRTDAFHRVILNPGAVLDHLRKAQDLKLKVADCPLVRYHVLKKYPEVEQSASGARNYSPSQPELSNIKAPPTFGLIYNHCHVQDVQVGSDAKAAGFRVGDSIVEINGQVTIGLTDDVIMNHIHTLRQKTEVTVCTMPAVLAAELDLARIVAGKKPPRILLKDEKKPPHPFKGLRLPLLGKKKKEYTTTSAVAKQTAPPPLHSGSLASSECRRERQSDPPRGGSVIRPSAPEQNSGVWKTWPHRNMFRIWHGHKEARRWHTFTREIEVGFEIRGVEFEMDPG